MSSIPVAIDLLVGNYPMRPSLTPELKAFMDSISGTPCCVQMSHALNLSGQVISQTYDGQRRNNSPITVSGQTYYYLLAVDEMELWMTLKYGNGESVNIDDTGNTRAPPAIKAYLQGRPGVLVFRNTGYGFHTEIWDGTDFVQKDMNRDACLSQSRVLFWDCEVSAAASTTSQDAQDTSTESVQG